MSKSFKRSRFQNRTRLGVESLEDRRLLAGNISATFFGGNLVLRGDAADNAVTVSQTSPTTVSVLGKTNSGSDTTINGTSLVMTFYGVLQSIDVDLKAGNDQFLVGNNSSDVNKLNNEILFGTFASTSEQASARTVVKNGIVFRGGDGIDAASIIADVGGDIYADLGANDDGILVQNSVVKGSVILEGGTGDQPTIFVRNSTVYNQIIMNGGSGSNRMLIGGSSAAGATINTKDGNDTVLLSFANIYSNLTINTLAGADSVELNSVSIRGSAILNSGAGDDLVTINNTSIRYDANINTGHGNDNVKITAIPDLLFLASDATVGGALVIDLGIGDDKATIGSNGNGQFKVKVTGYTTIIGSDGSDDFTVVNSVFGNGFTADMGAGKDMVNLKDVTIARNLSVFLGLGDDALFLDSTAAAFADLYGGLGSDGFKLTGNSFGRLTQREFERAIV